MIGTGQGRQMKDPRLDIDGMIRGEQGRQGRQMEGSSVRHLPFTQSHHYKPTHYTIPSLQTTETLQNTLSPDEINRTAETSEVKSVSSIAINA